MSARKWRDPRVHLRVSLQNFTADKKGRGAIGCGLFPLLGYSNTSSKAATRKTGSRPQAVARIFEFGVE